MPAPSEFLSHIAIVQQRIGNLQPPALALLNNSSRADNGLAIRDNAELSRPGLDALGLRDIILEDVQRLDSVQNVDGQRRVGQAAAQRLAMLKYPMGSSPIRRAKQVRTPISNTLAGCANASRRRRGIPGAITPRHNVDPAWSDSGTVSQMTQCEGSTPGSGKKPIHSTGRGGGGVDGMSRGMG